MVKADNYLSPAEVDALGLAHSGRNVFISRRAVLAHPERIHLGSYVRIDDFTLITAGHSVSIGDHVHLGSSVTIAAAAPVSIGSFSGLSAGVKLFTTDDDYSGSFLTGPTVPAEYTNIKTAGVKLGEHCVIGSNSVILPGAELEDGVVVGALSMVKERLGGWAIYGGVPAAFLRDRSQKLLALAKEKNV